ncbi:MAG: hypothetical protein ACXAC5_02595 [Promethearchaeota archaeon]|jgi:uncharacterized protein YihD (DUF1040 family)
MLDANLNRIGDSAGFMKNPIPRHLDRIPKVLKEIEELWRKVPDLRLGQFLENCSGSELKLYYMEDDVLLKKLQTMYGEVDEE